MAIPFTANPMGISNSVKWSKLTTCDSSVTGSFEENSALIINDIDNNSLFILSNDEAFYGNSDNSFQASDTGVLITDGTVYFSSTDSGVSIGGTLTLADINPDDFDEDLRAVQLKELKEVSSVEKIALNKSESNPNYVTCLSDKAISDFFEEKFQKLSGSRSAVFEVAVPSYNYDYGATASQNTPWRQQKIDPNIPSFRKLRDNIGLTPYFRYVGSDEDTFERRQQGDDYLNFPLFQDYYCNYVYDKNGNRRVTAIQEMCDGTYKESGAVDVGILSPAFWVKVKENFITIDELTVLYPSIPVATLQTYCTEKDGVYGIEERIFGMTLEVPAGEEEDWHYWSAGVRHNGEKSPFMVHTPYLASKVGGKYRSQPYQDAVQSISHNNLITFYASAGGFKGNGYHGGTIELWSWAILNMLVKYGCKSSQLLAHGVASEVIGAGAIWYKQNGEIETPKTLAVAKTPATNNDYGYYPVAGTYVAITKGKSPSTGNYLMSNKYNACTIDGKLMCHVLITDVKLVDDTLYYTFDELPNDFVFGYDTSSLYCITQAFPMGGMEKVVGKENLKGSEVYKFDGCVGKSYKAYFSPWRIRLCEFGQGLWDTMSDIVAVGTGSVANVYMCPKGSTRYNTSANILANYCLIGTKANANGWPSDFDFIFFNSDGNFVDACFYPKYSTKNQMVSNQNYSWGDYYWDAHGNNSVYEFILGGYVYSGPRCGLCRLDSFNPLPNAMWHLAARD